MRKRLILLGLLLWAAIPAKAELSIGIHVSLFPQLVMVPGYPVYYAPELESNYFFYDGAYWVYASDHWYSSYWYDGPWEFMDPEFVPLYVLRVPVRYYRRPPRYFGGWQADAPPRWAEHWGSNWSQRRSGWDRWDRHAIPAPAPLPVYQRQYSGARYPQVNEQRALQYKNYSYRTPTPRQHGGPIVASPPVADRLQQQPHGAERPRQQPLARPRPQEPRSPDRQSQQQPSREQPPRMQKSANEKARDQGERPHGDN